MLIQIMPSAAQIKARKAFVKKYAKKGKRSKSKEKLYPPSGKGLKEYHADMQFPQRWKKMNQDQKTAEIEKDVRQHMKWTEAKRKYGYGTVDLLQFYFNVSYNMRKKLGLPKTPPKYGQSPAL